MSRFAVIIFLVNMFGLVPLMHCTAEFVDQVSPDVDRSSSSSSIAGPSWQETTVDDNDDDSQVKILRRNGGVINSKGPGNFVRIGRDSDLPTGLCASARNTSFILSDLIKSTSLV